MIDKLEPYYLTSLGLAQLGQENYKAKARFELSFMEEKIKQLCGDPPNGILFKREQRPHDFGTYIELVMYYDRLNISHVRYFDKVDEMDWEEHEGELEILWENVNKVKDGMKDYHTDDQNFGINRTLNQLKGHMVAKESDEKPRRLTVEEVMESNGSDDLDSYMSELMFDSVVPACCEAGCEVEPDGTCQHGHPSILLSLGVI